jgi:Zn-dependent peptidase ImmA (M78 family)
MRRKRFSISHELGHWHHDRGHLLFCAAEDIGRAAPGILNRERLADWFASNLLMPEYLFRPVAARHRKIDFAAVRAIADAFDTSANRYRNPGRRRQVFWRLSDLPRAARP